MSERKDRLFDEVGEKGRARVLGLGDAGVERGRRNGTGVGGEGGVRDVVVKARVTIGLGATR